MAYAFVSSGNAAGIGAAPTRAVNATISAGEGVVVVVMMHNSGGAVTGVADALGNTYVEVAGGPFVDVGDEIFAIFYAKNAAGGTSDITASFTTDAGYSAIAYFRYTGLSTSADGQVMGGSTQAASGTGTDALTSGNVTPTAQPALVFGITVDGDGSSTITAGTGYTTRGTLSNWNSAIGFNTAVEDKRITSTSAVAATFTTNQGAHRMNTVAAVFTEAAAGGGSSPRSLLTLGVG